MKSESILSQLDLFSTSVLNSNIESSTVVGYQPIASLNENNPIEFYVPGTDEFIDLSQTKMRIKAKIIKADGTLVPDTEKVGPVNLFGSSLFQQIDVHANGVSVQSSNSAAAYIAYLEDTLNYSGEAKRTMLGSEMYYKDKPSDPRQMWMDEFKNSENGMLNRSKRTNASKIVEMVCSVHLDIVKMNKFLVNNVDLKFRFIRSNRTFPVISLEAGQDYKAVIEEMTLYIRKIQIKPDLALALFKVQEETNEPFVYPITQTVMKCFSVPKGTVDITRENLFLGNIPSRIVITIVRNDAFNGTLATNPYFLEHFDLNYLSVSVNNKSFPEIPFTPEYQNGIYGREYAALFTGLDLWGKNKGNDITYEDFGNGYCVYCLDLTSLGQSGGEAHTVPQQGNLKITMKFRVPLPDNKMVIVYSEFDREMYITRDRTVLYNLE